MTSEKSLKFFQCSKLIHETEMKWKYLSGVLQAGKNYLALFAQDTCSWHYGIRSSAMVINVAPVYSQTGWRMLSCSQHSCTHTRNVVCIKAIYFLPQFFMLHQFILPYWYPHLCPYLYSVSFTSPKTFACS